VTLHARIGSRYHSVSNDRLRAEIIGRPSYGREAARVPSVRHRVLTTATADDVARLSKAERKRLRGVLGGGCSDCHGTGLATIEIGKGGAKGYITERCDCGVDVDVRRVVRL